MSKLNRNDYTHQLTKKDRGYFICKWYKDGIVAFPELKLNLHVIVDELEIPNTSLLLHWQGRPKGLRRWGLYDIANDTYYSVPHEAIVFDAPFMFKTREIDENEHTVLPTAMIEIENAIVTPFEDPITLLISKLLPKNINQVNSPTVDSNATINTVNSQI